MDKSEAIRLFVKRNSSIFRLDPFPWGPFKKLKRDFFLNFAKTPVPKDSEIGGEILEGMIRSSQIDATEDLEKILELPFFKSRIRNKPYIMIG